MSAADEQGAIGVAVDAFQGIAALTDEQLVLFATFIEGNPHRRWSFRVLGLNRHTATVRDGALRDLRADLRLLGERTS